MNLVAQEVYYKSPKDQKVKRMMVFYSTYPGRRETKLDFTM